MRIPLFSLERQNLFLKKRLEKEIKEVIESGCFILGKRVEAFEKAFASYLGVKYAVGVASGTDALSLALLALGVKRGEEVILPANAYPTVFAVTAVGAFPRLVDIEPKTFNLDPEKLAAAISRKTRAIIVVHLYGQPASIFEIGKISAQYRLPLIEDCAQAHGAEVKVCPFRKKEVWRKVGSLGTVGCFSFYPTKNLGAFGDGGMVVTNNEEIYERVKLLRMYGEKKRYQSVILGRNSRLDELQAGILLLKLPFLDSWNERRRKLATFYCRLLEKEKEIILPKSEPDKKSIYHLFVIRTKKREKMRAFLKTKGIETGIHYPLPIHLVPSMKFLGYKKGDFPESERAAREILSLPMFPELQEKEAEKVAEGILEFFREEKFSS